MNICFAIDDSIYRPGGVQYNVLKLAQWFVNQKSRVTILHSPNPSVQEYSLYHGIDVIPIARGFDIKGLSFNGSVSPFPGFAKKKKIEQILVEKQFDVIFFNYPFSPFISGLTTKIAKNLSKQGLIRTKLIATVLIYVEESFLPRLGNKLLAWTNQKAINTIDVFTHCSNPAKEYVDTYLRTPSVYIPLCSWNINSKDTLERSTGKNTTSLLFLGRLELRKGVLDFIEALHMIPKELLPKTTVTIAGDGIQRAEAEKLAKTYSLPITFLGRVSDEQKHQCYMDADIAIFPSKYGESFGIVLTEAMSYGCAIVGYANAGYAFTMGPYRDETLVAPNDIQALAHKITEMIENKEKTKILGANLKNFFIENYSVEVVGRKLEESTLNAS